MPELPEVETIRLQLETILPKLKIKAVEVKTARIFQGNSKLLVGKSIKGLRRFGKMLIIDLTGGLSIAVHLRMTGRLVFEKFKIKNLNFKLDQEINYAKDKHTHIIITFTNGAKLYYHDVRKFGFVQIVPTRKVGEIGYIKNLGPEFLSNLTIAQFNKIVKFAKVPIKLLLLDQQKLAGAGNIYTNEALWCAKVSPGTPADKISGGQIAKLFSCLETTLMQAIKFRGASRNDYRDAFGQKGEVQDHFQVYDRVGELCRRCQTIIKKITLGDRGTYYCPAYQKN